MYLLRVFLTLYVFLATPHHTTCTRWMYACLCCFLGMLLRVLCHLQTFDFEQMFGHRIQVYSLLVPRLPVTRARSPGAHCSS